ncbi:MAG TPA: branched-chain-amino-acid transaminase [Gemmatimonadales bacterium]|nr:branched-chain-amino-acid transaminase [Gemmatimonadales bacterium]
MATTIWIDGQYYDRDSAKVSVFDHGLLYGDGVFEGIRAYDGKIFRLREHLERLYDSAKAIALTIPMSIEEMTAMTEEALQKSGIGNAYLRHIVTRGVGDLGLDPRNCPRPTVILIVDTIKLFKSEVIARGLTGVTAGTPIPQREALSPRIKSLNYLAHIMAKLEGINAGADEVLMLEAGGTVAEGSGQNLFIVKQGVLKTTPPWAGILKGVTRDAVLELAAEMAMPVQETMLNRYDVYTADEAFFTGTASELIAIRTVDGRQIGTEWPGATTKRLQEAFAQLVRR